jgi:DNA uptake protein ComE-like DNA-binding protein
VSRDRIGPVSSGGGAWVWLLAGWLVASVRVSPPSIVGESSAIESRIPAREPPSRARVDLARLSPRDLRTLPGIGESRALAIAREGWERGRLDVGDLDAIPSIGEGTVDRARAWIERTEARR